MTITATGMHYGPDVDEQIDIYADRELHVEVDGDVLRLETCGLPEEADKPLGSPGVSLEVPLTQVPALVERLKAVLATALADEPLPHGMFAVHD